ncbi:hypothetical protein GH714_005286 [Hevea brasiliensis]|uniref:Uncharacterized protein n=1 Tax=Hevea brasiliensis TaxID=3981 RepID=A0A6A6MBE5_HEVBR|nr:hypothetical protein GH714_005286 [Hevea brasiliensis]
MEPAKPSNPLLSLSTFIHQHCLRLGAELATRFGDTNRALTANLPPGPTARRLRTAPFFASVSQQKHAAAAGTLSSEHVAKTLAGTAVYTVSNTNNEFVLISDPDGAKSISLLCFRQEDAETFLAQVIKCIIYAHFYVYYDFSFLPFYVLSFSFLFVKVRLRRRELRSEAKVVPITLDQVYMLKVEGIAFRFLPDPVQIKNALELKAADIKTCFDGVPVFQSDLLVVKKKNKRYCPIYFQKVGSLEDVLRKMEISEKNSGWEDLIFIPPGKSCSQHIQEMETGVKMKAVLEESQPSTPKPKRNMTKIEVPSFMNNMGKGMKIGMVNMDEDDVSDWKIHGEIIPIYFERVSEFFKWEDLFPEWIDEEEELEGTSCPEIPMPDFKAYDDIDIIVAKLPCKYPQELWNREEGDWWFYEPDMSRLEQKASLPIGSCKLALPLWAKGIDETYDVSKIQSTTRTARREAYVTVLHSSESYVCGAIALAQSLLQTGTKRDLILLLDRSISQPKREALAAAGWKIRLIKRIRNPRAEKYSYNEYNYSKFRLWQLTDYDKIIFIDSTL